MAMNRQIREAIINAIKEEQAVTVDEVVEIVKTYEEMPDVKNLVEQHYKKVARRLLSTIKDDYGVRDFFAAETAAGERLYVNIAASDNLEHLSKVEQQLKPKAAGTARSYAKARKRQMEVAGQLVFDFKVEG